MNVRKILELVSRIRVCDKRVNKTCPEILNSMFAILYVYDFKFQRGIYIQNGLGSDCALEKAYSAAV
jgi:uncharacterized protein involved in type VI secretion and phage assembly